ncbi:MAG TPA: hypothetical protein [Caudoviricetes sp.]|nr:MAG TPA: hypothetical protein [Caudoviricetes sp.]
MTVATVETVSTTCYCRILSGESPVIDMHYSS